MGAKLGKSGNKAAQMRQRNQKESEDALLHGFLSLVSKAVSRTQTATTANSSSKVLRDLSQ